MLQDKFLIISNMSFMYDSSTQYLFKNIDITFAPGWTGIIGSNGSGKTTLLKLAAGILEAKEGLIINNDSYVFCEQRMDFMTESITDFMYAYDSYACKLRSKFNIGDEWGDRWQTLSFGERKRMQIAAAVWQEPTMLVIDEPTNHLDIVSKQYLFDLMKLYRGTGLLVSHDRKFLDELCKSCVFVEPPGITIYKGGYSQSIEQKKVDEDRARNELKVARSNYNKLKKEHSKRKHEASLSDAKRSKRKIDKKDNDARGRIRAAIVTGRDATAGKLQSQLAGRLDQYLDKLKNSNAKKIEELGIWVKGEASRKDTLLNIEAAKISFESAFELNYPELIIRSDNKIALTGSNGTGKSTLIKTILKNLHVTEEKYIYIPQEINIQKSKEIINDIKQLPNERLGKVMSLIKRLGSEPARLLETELPSPGELRKLCLAMGISKAPELIIMDEPTNHLDLTSIECIENALNECPCSLLLISHDFYFLEKLTNIRWDISKNENGICVLQKKYW
jgi:macrolide transport system ATP-binding/permease protein